MLVYAHNEKRNDSGADDNETTIRCTMKDENKRMIQRTAGSVFVQVDADYTDNSFTTVGDKSQQRQRH